MSFHPDGARHALMFGGSVGGGVGTGGMTLNVTAGSVSQYPIISCNAISTESQNLQSAGADGVFRRVMA